MYQCSWCRKAKSRCSSATTATQTTANLSENCIILHNLIMVVCERGMLSIMCAYCVSGLYTDSHLEWYLTQIYFTVPWSQRLLEVPITLQWKMSEYTKKTKKKPHKSTKPHRSVTLIQYIHGFIYLFILENWDFCFYFENDFHSDENAKNSIKSAVDTRRNRCTHAAGPGKHLCFPSFKSRDELSKNLQP